MTCEDYQDLIDRGWRRYGYQQVKTNMHKKTCTRDHIVMRKDSRRRVIIWKAGPNEDGTI
jgi:hypothetical protein